MGNSILSESGITIVKNRYSFDENEDWQGLSTRIGREAARAENGNQTFYENEFGGMIYDMDFLAGGRILRNMGRPRGSLFNCYVVPVGDSREEIGQWLKDSLILWGEGGGVGCNLSYLRPRGAVIKGVGGNSSGPVSFLEASDGVANTIESGGSRRAAALACMSVTHPDIMEFIDAKMIHGKLSHYNISVAVTDDFLTAVEADSIWEFKFAQQAYGTIRAREIWDKIVENMVNHAEPGLIHWENLTSNNSYYFDPIVATNPCGEVALGSYGVCCLGSLVLPHFITGNINTNWKKLEATIKLAVRFLDNVIDINKYVLREVDINAHNGRRIGMGVMGLAEYLFAKKVKYGSQKAIEETERLMRFIRDAIYETSIELAVEKGAFPKFDAVAYSKAHFVRSLPAKLRMAIKDKGIRNITCMAMAPTGTISLLPEVSSGIEPLFRKAYMRSDRVSDRMYVHPIYKDILDRGEEIPEWFVDTDDLKPEDHFETQAVVQKYTDGAVSKTINMPEGTTKEELSRLTLEYVHDLKGVTVYVDQSREGQILNKITKKEIKDYLETGNIKTAADEDTTNCASGVCEL
jgi:ribonucleoside-diphosphate reductase alpha chain